MFYTDSDQSLLFLRLAGLRTVDFFCTVSTLYGISARMRRYIQRYRLHLPLYAEALSTQSAHTMACFLDCPASGSMRYRMIHMTACMHAPAGHAAEKIVRIATYDLVGPVNL